MRPHLVALIFAMMPTGTIAGSSSYICRITDFLAAPGEGNPVAAAQQAMETPLAIDRLTGRAIHPIIGNSSFPIVKVLDPGGDGWSFKSFASSETSNGHTSIVYIEVDEFAEGFEKPLLAMSNGFAFSGSCM